MKTLNLTTETSRYNLREAFLLLGEFLKNTTNSNKLSFVNDTNVKTNLTNLFKNSLGCLSGIGYDRFFKNIITSDTLEYVTSDTEVSYLDSETNKIITVLSKKDIPAIKQLLLTMKDIVSENKITFTSGYTYGYEMRIVKFVLEISLIYGILNKKYDLINLCFDIMFGQYLTDYKKDFNDSRKVGPMHSSFPELDYYFLKYVAINHPKLFNKDCEIIKTIFESAIIHLSSDSGTRADVENHDLRLITNVNEMIMFYKINYKKMGIDVFTNRKYDIDYVMFCRKMNSIVMKSQYNEKNNELTRSDYLALDLLKQNKIYFGYYLKNLIDIISKKPYYEYDSLRENGYNPQHNYFLKLNKLMSDEWNIHMINFFNNYVMMNKYDSALILLKNLINIGIVSDPSYLLRLESEEKVIISPKLREYLLLTLFDN